MADSGSRHGGPGPVNQFGTPVAVNQFGTPVAVNQFGTPVAVNQFGTPVAPTQFPPPYGAPAYPPAGWVPPGTAPPKRRVGLFVGIAVGAVLLIAVAIAAAVPLVLAHRPDRIAFPDTVVGMSRTHDEDAQLAQLLAPYEGLGLGRPQAATYLGANGQVAVVVAASHSLSVGNEQGYLTGFTREEQQNYAATMAPVPPGPLGGALVCGEAKGTRTDCGYADNGGYGVIDVSGTGQGALDLVLRIRSAVENHS